MSGLEVWTLPCLSQEFEEGPLLHQAPGSLVLRYDFETEDGSYEWESLVFTSVAALKFTDTDFCTAEQVAALDRLIDVKESPWREELRDPNPNLHHYRIYFDDIGCYEVLATTFVPPAERR